MNYKQVYDKIIQNRQNNSILGYTENHHIIPKCLGGSDNKYNLVRLSAREHFVCHKLLTKIYKNKKLIFALWAMCNQKNKNQERKQICSYDYAEAKKLFSETISGENHWAKTDVFRNKMKKIASKRPKDYYEKIVKIKIKNGTTGKGVPKSEEHKQKIGLGNKNKKRTDEQNKKQSLMMKSVYKNGFVNGMKGIKREKSLCEHCNKYFDVANMKRWHGENCKHKKD